MLSSLRGCLWRSLVWALLGGCWQTRALCFQGNKVPHVCDIRCICVTICTVWKINVYMYVTTYVNTDSRGNFRWLCGKQAPFKTSQPILLPVVQSGKSFHWRILKGVSFTSFQIPKDSSKLLVVEGPQSPRNNIFNLSKYTHLATLI